MVADEGDLVADVAVAEEATDAAEDEEEDERAEGGENVDGDFEGGGAHRYV